MSKEIIAKAQERMNQSHQSLAREFSHIRAGVPMLVCWTVFQLSTTVLQRH